MKNATIIDDLDKTDMPKEMIREIMSEPIKLSAIYLAGKVVEARTLSEAYEEEKS